jgi:sugar O-acyltransferase (sialic acid O-acetyltransferase NeuD family)
VDEMSKVVLFGSGKIADVVYFQLTHDSHHEVVAFTVDGVYIAQKEKWGLPVIAFEEILDRYPPEDFKMLVAVGYQDLNRFRARKYVEAKAKGYELISYVSSRASNFSNVPVGDNCLILENASLQPCSWVGNNVFFWNGNHLGHHAHIEDHCYVAGQVVISGMAVVGPYCFLGVNATIGHEVTVGQESFIGAGTLITKNVTPKSVYITADTPKFRLDSDSFLKLTKMK